MVESHDVLNQIGLNIGKIMTWSIFKYWELTESKRQEQDEKFSQRCSRIHVENQIEEDLDLLSKYVIDGDI